MKKFFVLFLLGSMFLIQSCSKEAGPVEPEDATTQVSFANDVQPIFDNNCVSCHPSSGNLDLRPGQSYNQLVNVSASGYNALRVKPGDPEASVLYKKIDGSGTFGSNMPLGGQLSAADIQTIKTWIEQGAQNN